MNEAQIKARWANDRTIYHAWGTFVRDRIVDELSSRGHDPAAMLKIPAIPRLKDEISLVDKALYRGKDYSDPYNEIEDKVGVRFVVLLLSELNLICKVIGGLEDWVVDPCRHFEQDRLAEPLLFTYQSVHFILRPSQSIKYSDIEIPETTTCEVQIRTLLQHAHAELTHDAIYKSKKEVPSKVHRTVAKSIALIEATDEFFEDVVTDLNTGPLIELGILKRLDGLYHSLTGYESHTQKSALLIWDAYEKYINENLIDNIQSFVGKTPELAEVIKQRYADNILCQQSTVLFLYWMLKKRRRPLIRRWPLSLGLLQALAVDIGVSLDN